MPRFRRSEERSMQKQAGAEEPPGSSGKLHSVTGFDVLAPHSTAGDIAAQAGEAEGPFVAVVEGNRKGPLEA